MQLKLRYILPAVIVPIILLIEKQGTSQDLAPSLDLKKNVEIRTGAMCTELYFDKLYNKKIALVANHTSTIGPVHLADSLLAAGIDLKLLFTPEHGLRGEADAGEKVGNSIDSKTGLAIISLYGENKKPRAQQLEGIDMVVFDIQDVGARFYTYISTLHYVMEACAEQGVPVLVLDRPNPNGFYVDGPILNKNYRSFVGMHPVPVVHGMSVGEYAQMINGEKWLLNGVQCALEVIPCQGWDHLTEYRCPIPPSPNLPNQTAIYLYPSLCFFEGTLVSVGRGTEFPFQAIGYPQHPVGMLRFTPVSKTGAKKPLYEGRECRGHDLRAFGEFYFTSTGALYLDWLLGMYSISPDKAGFFNSPDFFDKLAGSDQLRKDIIAGKSIEEIRSSWKEGLEGFRDLRSKYLLYEDFK
jgi:uncharacterized protein YbbC (DUF1343 family)